MVFLLHWGAMPGPICGFCTPWDEDTGMKGILIHKTLWAAKMHSCVLMLKSYVMLLQWTCTTITNLHLLLNFKANSIIDISLILPENLDAGIK